MLAVLYDVYNYVYNYVGMVRSAIILRWILVHFKSHYVRIERTMKYCMEAFFAFLFNSSLYKRFMF